MIKGDLKTFSGLMKTLSVNSGAVLSKDTLMLYFKALEGYTIEQIETSVKEVLLTWTAGRMPPLAIIVKYVNGQEPTIEDRAKVMATRITAHVEGTKQVHFPDFIAEDEIATYLMTEKWPYFSWSTTVLTKDLVWWEKDFREAYISFTNTEKIQELNAPAPGKVIKLAASVGKELE